MTRPTDKEIYEFYENTYRLSETLGENYPERRNRRTQVIRAQRQLSLIHEDLPRLDTGVDIGCALGWMVRIMKFLGMDAYGVEPSKIDREFTKKELEIDINADLKELKGIGFDLVNMSHVLEHLPDPIGFLTTLKKDYMNPKGLLVIEVPSLRASSAWSAFHTIAFTPASLEYSLATAGYKVTKMIGEGYTKNYDKSLIWAVGKAR